MSATPASRRLPAVMRALLDRPSPGAVRLVIGTYAAPPAGGAAAAYANVTIEGTTITVPKLSGAVTTSGKPAYLLATDDFMLALGTVTL